MPVSWVPRVCLLFLCLCMCLSAKRLRPFLATAAAVVFYVSLFVLLAEMCCSCCRWVVVMLMCASTHLQPRHIWVPAATTALLHSCCRMLCMALPSTCARHLGSGIYLAGRFAGYTGPALCYSNTDMWAPCNCNYLQGYLHNFLQELPVVLLRLLALL